MVEGVAKISEAGTAWHDHAAGRGCVAACPSFPLCKGCLVTNELVVLTQLS